MIHYIGWSWPAADRERHQRVAALAQRIERRDPRWKCVFQAPGIHVIAALGPHDAPVVRLHDRTHRHDGVIIGPLFRDESPAPQELDENESAAIAGSAGHHLVSRYWGNYVAILRGHRTDEIILIRGPCATLPCLRRSEDDVESFFSSADLCDDASLTAGDIDWPAVACRFLGPITLERTGLRAVRELLPGFSETVAPSRCERQRCWHPQALARDAQIESPAAAARCIRNVVDRCTRAWVSGHDSVLHGLSGGLDSSVILASLRNALAGERITCVTHFAEGADSDERSFARLAARRAGARHLEIRRIADIDLSNALHGARTASPPGLRIPEVDRVEPDLAHELGAGLIVKGYGGDEIFCRNLAIAATADLWRSHGRMRDVFSLALHSAVTEGITVWRTLFEAWRLAFLPARTSFAAELFQQHGELSLLNPDLVHAALSDDSLIAPDDPTPVQLLPGKRQQLALATGPRPWGSPHSRIEDAIVVAPLLAQPAIETALRIPTWLQFEKRGERAVLRDAFADVLPSQILRRRGKGGADELARDILRSNRAFVREQLLDGHLMRERFVHRSRLHDALSERPRAGSAAAVPLFDLLGAEIWLRKWLRS